MQTEQKVILASSSPYRHQQLSQLGFDFACIAPQIDETPLPGETPADLVQRLATAKAATVLREQPAALVIGCDQVAELNAAAIGKPHTLERARAQLKACSKRTVVFYTAVSIASSSASFSEIVLTQVRFSALNDDMIDAYLKREQPLDCAGSFKCEGLGIALFESITSNDPSALIGLPLIATRRLLGRHNYYVL